MKVSVQVEDTPNQSQNHHNQTPVLIRAKIPITILNLPFLSIFSTSTTNHNPSLSLRTNFSSGPSLKLSYNPTTTTHSPPPLSFTLKSGTSLSGSPNNSPLIISAHFSLNPLNPTSPNPTFSLLFKPRLGDFSLRKSVHSSPSSAPDANVKSPIGFLEREEKLWKELRVGGDEVDVFKGMLVMANTKMPVAKRVGLSLRWGFGFREGFGKGLPVLSVNKVGIERVVEEVKKDEEKKIVGGNAGEEEVLKGMVGWMRRELDVLQRENREMRRDLEEMRVGASVMKSCNVVSAGGKAAVKGMGTTSGFEKWRSKKISDGGGGEEMGKKELSKVGNTVIDVESELQRAIKAASSAS